MIVSTGNPGVAESDFRPANSLRSSGRLSSVDQVERSDVLGELLLIDEGSNDSFGRYFHFKIFARFFVVEIFCFY